MRSDAKIKCSPNVVVVSVVKETEKTKSFF